MTPDPGRSGGEGTGEFDIQFTILRGGEEIGFGGATARSLEEALYEVQSIIQNEMWETANG